MPVMAIATLWSASAAYPTYLAIDFQRDRKITRIQKHQTNGDFYYQNMRFNHNESQ